MSWKELLRRMVRSKFFMIGFFFVFAMVLIAVIGPSRVVYPEIQNNLNERLKPPEGFARGFQGHILGTDQLGQDIFTRVIIGSRSSLIISFSSVFLSALLGTILGLVAGYFQGAVETVIMRIGDIQLSIPSLVLAIAVVAVLGPSVSNLILVLTFTGWIRFARIVRTDTMITRGKEFISASRVLGGSSFHIITTQILPNVLTSLIILTSQQFGFIILVEASLSFLGLGVPLPKASWGSMISAGRAYITTAPWLVLVPGFILMIAVLAFNFLGDGVRDVLDPKMKH